MESTDTLLNQRVLPVVGIVGGIGSGKSAVAKWVAARAPVTLIDADQLGHQALLLNSVREALRVRFGPSIFGDDGFVIRSKLARLVFGDSAVMKQNRRDLEQIVHPEIRRKIFEAIAQAADGPSQVVLLDAAVLFEAGWRALCDLVVFIDTPLAIRLDRVKLTRGWTSEELANREASQKSVQEKVRESDLTVSNDRDLDSAGQQLLESLQQRGWLQP